MPRKTGTGCRSLFFRYIVVVSIMVKVEEVPAAEVHVEDDTSSSESGDEMPTLESAGNGEGPDSKLNRNEKKARKAMMKLGMKQIPGVLRVTVKRSKSVHTC